MGPATIHGCGKPARPVSPEVSGDVIPFDAGRRSAHQRRGPGRLTQTFSPLWIAKERQVAESLLHLSNPSQPLSRLVELTLTKRGASYEL